MLLLFFATGTPAVVLTATEARDIIVYDAAVLLFILDRNVNVASHDTSVELELRKTIT